MSELTDQPDDDMRANQHRNTIEFMLVAHSEAAFPTGRPLLENASEDLDDEHIRKQIARCATLDESAAALAALLASGFLVWDTGELYLTKALVDRRGRLRMEIRLREHAPPHFHITAPNLDASFAIATGDLLSGRIGSQEARLVKYWYRAQRHLLIKIWNETRPSDCPVGPIELGQC